MKVIVQDQRHEERYHTRVREVPGYERRAWGSYSGKPGHRKDVGDRRTVSIELEPSDFTELDIPETERGSSKGKHDGTFFVRSVDLTFDRSYEYDEDNDPAETQHGWGPGHVVVGGPNKLATGAEGVKSNSTYYPKVRVVDDEDRPFTFEVWRASLTGLSAARADDRGINTLQDLRVSVANFDNEGKSYRQHPFVSELAKIEEGTHFFTKRVRDPLPDWVAEIVARFHPNTSVLEFIESDTNTYGPAFPAQREVVV